MRGRSDFLGPVAAGYTLKILAKSRVRHIAKLSCQANQTVKCHVEHYKVLATSHGHHKYCSSNGTTSNFLYLLVCCMLSIGRLYQLDSLTFGIDTLSRNVNKKLPIDAAQHPRRSKNSTTPRRKPQISHGTHFFNKLVQTIYP